MAGLSILPLMDRESKNKELPETERASMLNLAAFGSSQVGLTVTTAFAALSFVTGQVVPGVIFVASLLPQAGLCWLNSRHLKAYEGKPCPFIEPQERAQRRCRDAFRRLVAPAVVMGATFLLVNVAAPDPAPVKISAGAPEP